MVEMIKHANIVFKEDLLKKMNQGFQKLSFDESWHIAILQMIPKDGDSKELPNLHSIALLLLLYKIFSKLVYHRISSHLFQ